MEEKQDRKTTELILRQYKMGLPKIYIALKYKLKEEEIEKIIKENIPEK